MCLLGDVAVMDFSPQRRDWVFCFTINAAAVNAAAADQSAIYDSRRSISYGKINSIQSTLTSSLLVHRESHPSQAWSRPGSEIQACLGTSMSWSVSDHDTQNARWAQKTLHLRVGKPAPFCIKNKRIKGRIRRQVTEIQMKIWNIHICFPGLKPQLRLLCNNSFRI